MSSLITEESPLILSSHTTNSCIICLEDDEEEKEEMKKRLIIPSNIPFLNKNCSCHFYIHEHCFTLWFCNKQVCPICSSPIHFSFPIAANLNNNNIEIPPPVYTENIVVDGNNHAYKKRICIFLFYVILSFFLFYNFFPPYSH